MSNPRGASPPAKRTAGPHEDEHALRRQELPRLPLASSPGGTKGLREQIFPEPRDGEELAAAMSLAHDWALGHAGLHPASSHKAQDLEEMAEIVWKGIGRKAGTWRG